MRFSRLAWFAVVVLCLAVAAGATYVATRAQHTASPNTRAPIVQRPPVLAALAESAPVSAAGIRSALRPTTTAAALGGSLAGLVVDARTGDQLFARRATASVPPASTAKLLTAVAALTSLGPRTVMTTGVVRKGRTLYLVGGGDVTVTDLRSPSSTYPRPASLDDLARLTAAAVTASGTGRVRLRYDATAWSGPTLARGWSAGYLAGNVSRLSALEVDEAHVGRTANVPPGRKPPGFVPRAADPSRQAADVFASALRRHGLDVIGTARPGVAPASGLGIASVHSPPVEDLVQRMLTDSDNDLAEALGRLIARQESQPATFSGTATAIIAADGRAGVPTQGLRLYDASGLSRLDRVSPRSLVAVLRIVTGPGAGPLSAVTAGLPVAAFTGTLAVRYGAGRRRAGAGAVRAKTGTLAGVNALAGEVVDGDGRLLLFAFIADRVPAPVPAERALDTLAARLAGCGCP